MSSILQIKDANGNWIPVPSITGPKGDKGDTGANGYTPVRGEDYWTESDKTEIVADVIAQLASGDEVGY